MGNNHEGLNGQINNNFKTSKNKKYKKGEETNNNNSEDEKDVEKNNVLSEYDKELSHMLFDDDSDEEENNKNKKPKRKKTLKEELDDYAEQVAEEKFMEEINRSKSIRKDNKKDDSDDDDDEEDDYAAFKRWKEKQKNKKKKKGEKEKEIKNHNIKTLNNNDDNDDNNDNGNLNINKEIKNKKNKKTQEKKRVNSSDKSNNFKNNIKEKNAKAKKKNSKKEPEQEKDNNKITLTKENEEFIKQSMRNFCLQNQMKATTFRNNVPNYYNVLNNKENEKNEKSKYNTNTYNPNDIKSKTVMLQKNNKEKDKKKKSAEKEKDKPKKSLFSFLKKKDNNIISKKITEKMNKEDIRTVTLYMKNGNNKYEEGLQLCGLRNYNNALVCFAQSRNSFLQLSKLMNNNPRDYPKEFRKIINEKILDKLKLVNQSIRECNEYIKNGKNIQNTNSTNEILKNLNFKQNNKINNNFSQIDDSFNFNSDEPDSNPVFRNRNPNPNQNNVNKNIHQEEDSEMDAKVESEIMITNPGIKFSDIIGMQEMKKTLYEIIIVPSIRPDFFTGIRKPQRGILLFGPPGTGKTMIAKAIASECKSTFFNISASSLTSKWVGESEKTVKSLFKLAYRKTPSIIFIDEIDSILSKRTENENEATKRLKTEFLIQFDGLGSNNNAKLLVIAATNRPMDLDEALLRRLPKRVYCGPLDQNGRFDFIKKVINKVETNLSDKDIMEIAKMTKGYSNSDLKELCKEAAFQPVRELTMEQIMKIKKFRPLVKNDLVLAVNKIRGSLNNKIIGELLKWNEQFGGV